MKNKIYNYFFHEFMRYFVIVIFAVSSVIVTIQAVNFLDLVTSDGHAFKVYMYYSILTIPKIITKLIPFSFLIAVILTILKLDKDNELIILWTSGLNKINVVNLLLRISLIVMLFQLTMALVINPEALNYSRSLLKNSKLQVLTSLLKEKQFNDTVKGLTIFVDKKLEDNTYKNIFIRDDEKVLTDISDSSSTIFAKKAYISDSGRNLILINGNIQKYDSSGKLSIIKFEKTQMNLSNLSSRGITEPKIQETSTVKILKCLYDKNLDLRNCGRHKDNIKDTKIEINRRLGMPIFIPLIALISSFLLSTRRESKSSYLFKYIYFFIAFVVIIGSEIAVRYSGNSFESTLIYYSFPLIASLLTYLYLIKTFKYENLY